MDRRLSCKTSFDDLPDGLVVDILLRLPVKTIIQSTCVSKLWYSIIKTPSFVSSHLLRSRANCSGYYAYMFREYSPSIPVISDNHLLTRHPDFVYPFVIESKTLQLIGTCNGLVCASKDSRDIYMINPFIRKYKKLAFKSSCYAHWIKKPDERLASIHVGFGYSEVENDYKVVRIVNRYSNPPWALNTLGDLVYLPRDLETRGEIYSLKSGEWKCVDVSFEVSSHYSPVFVHGCLYWSAHQSSGPDKYLVCFDLKDEVFTRIEFPTTYLQLDSTLSRNILIKNGSVAVIAYENELDIIRPCTRIYIFELEKNVDGQVQWKELCYKCTGFNAGKCIGFSGVGRLLFLERNMEYQTEYAVVVAVDLDKSCAIEKLGVDANDIICGVTNVMESLVLLLDRCGGRAEQHVDIVGEDEDLFDILELVYMGYGPYGS